MMMVMIMMLNDDDNFCLEWTRALLKWWFLAIWEMISLEITQVLCVILDVPLRLIFLWNMYTIKFHLQPSPLINLNQNGIVQLGSRTCTARWTLKKRDITFRSSDNVVESRTNDYDMEKG